MTTLELKCQHGVYDPNHDGAACDQCLSKFRREGRLIRLVGEDVGLADCVEASQKRRLGECFAEMLAELDSDA